jgi:hypothetical protein
MFELVLVAALAGGLGLMANSNPVNIQIEFDTVDRCTRAGDELMADLKAKGMVILSSRCVKTKD